MARPPISGGQGGGGGGVESQFEEEEEEVVVTLEIVGDRARGEERESEARDLGTATDDKAGGDGGGGGVESIFQEEELTAEEGVGGHARGEVGAEDLDHGDEVEEDSVERVLLKLKVLCAVLGSNYKEKLDEIGLVSGSEIITSEMKTKLLKMVQFLQGAKQERFEKMQKSANELLSVWKKSKQPVERLLKVYQIFDIISAKSADEIITEKFLSAPLLKKIEKEKKSILSADLTLLKEKYQRNKKKLQQLLKDQHLTTLDVGFNAKEKIDEVDYPNKIESVRELIKNLRKNRLPRMLLVLKMELIGTGRNEKFSVEQLKSLIQVTKAFVRESLSDGEACMYDGRDVMDVLIEAERKLDPKQGDSCKDYQSSRSVRLAARLKKKEMGSCTVQEAAVSSISIRRKLRSGMDKNRDEVPMSKEAADTAKSKAQEDLTEAERDASNPPED